MFLKKNEEIMNMKLFSIIYLTLLSCISIAEVKVTIKNIGNYAARYTYLFDDKKIEVKKSQNYLMASQLLLENPVVTSITSRTGKNGEKILDIELKPASIDIVSFADDGKYIDYPNAIYLPSSTKYYGELNRSKYPHLAGKLNYIILSGTDVINIRATGKDAEALSPLLSARSNDHVWLEVTGEDYKESDSRIEVTIYKK